MTVTFEEVDAHTVKRIDADGNEMFIPVDIHNGFYKRYLRWQATGSEFAQHSAS